MHNCYREHILKFNWKIQTIILCGLHIWIGRKEGHFCLMTHSTHFIYGYMASDIWLRTILIVKKETSCRHIGYSFRLIGNNRCFICNISQTGYHSLCYTSREALAGTSKMVQWVHHEVLIQWHITPLVKALQWSSISFLFQETFMVLCVCLCVYFYACVCVCVCVIIIIIIIYY